MISKELTVVASPIKRSKEVKMLHASQGIDDSVVVFNKFSLPENSEAVRTFQSAIDAAYEGLAKDLPEALISVIDESQFSTTVEITKEYVKNNPFPAHLQSWAHRTNLTDAGVITVWEVEKDGVSVSKENLASGISLD